MADWSEQEIQLIIADYFQMLNAEIRGLPYSKSEFRNRLLERLKTRTKGSVEFKHQNISAVLINNGLPYINGYKPRWNYQQLLEEKVMQFISSDDSSEREFEAFADRIVDVSERSLSYEHWVVEAPSPSPVKTQATSLNFKPFKKNYLAEEQRNRSIGESGEKLVFDYERWRLTKAGYSKLADKVEWVSRDQGDGAGFDILSKDFKGSDIFIEVKSTTLGKDTPIFFSKREHDFSIRMRDHFHLYRVFDLKSQPKLFTRAGSFQEVCKIEPTQFKGIF